MPIEHLRTILSADQILSDEEIRNRYEHIWTMNSPLRCKAFLLPRTTDELSQVMMICHQSKQPVVIHGGLTNLVGGTKSTADSIVISMERMNKILDIDEISRTMTVESGVILEEVQKAAADHDLLFPLNFGARGTAQIGGCIATNAGGLRVFRYGMTRNQVLGLEVVLPDGTIYSSLKKLIKDNTGYDIKQLFIGSEGTLGVITKAVLRLYEAHTSRISAFLAFDSYEQVVKCLKFFDRELEGRLSAFEMLGQLSYVDMTAHLGSKKPLKHHFNYYALIECLGANSSQSVSEFERIIENAFIQNLMIDGAIANTQFELDLFWNIREEVGRMVNACRFDHHFDISIPTAHIGQFVAEAEEQLTSLSKVNKVYSFGHIADGNIHFIVDRQSNDSGLINQVNDIVYQIVARYDGSISAEHGIGLDKRRYLHFSCDQTEIDLMKRLKQMFDPHNILNQGRIISV